MKSESLPAPKDDVEEIFELVEMLHRTEQRLEELTSGQVDSIVDRQGQTFFLRRAQEELRSSEAVRQAAILNALSDARLHGGRAADHEFRIGDPPGRPRSQFGIAG